MLFRAKLLFHPVTKTALCQYFASIDRGLACRNCALSCIFCGSPDDLVAPVFVCEEHARETERCCRCGKYADQEARCCARCARLQRNRRGCVWNLDNP